MKPEGAFRSNRATRPRPTLSGVEHMPARDRAYHDLRYRILTGRLAPGTTLLETELAALLSLSTMVASHSSATVMPAPPACGSVRGEYSTRSSRP